MVNTSQPHPASQAALSIAGCKYSMSPLHNATTVFAIISGATGQPGSAQSTLTKELIGAKDSCLGCACWPPRAKVVKQPVIAQEPNAQIKPDFSLAINNSCTLCSSCKHTDPSIKHKSISGISSA